MGTVVLLSGGMDSTVAFFWALNNRPAPIDAVVFNYGQRAAGGEVDAAIAVWGKALQRDPESKLANLNILHLRGALEGHSSLLNPQIPVAEYDSNEEAVKANTSDNSYIPLRNAVLISVAANHGLVNYPDGFMLVTGSRGRAAGPNGGFPDGSPEFADMLTVALSIGAFGTPIDSNRMVKVWDPLNRPGRSRVDALKMAEHFPGCWEALGYSMTCFHGIDPPCGRCLPCVRRAAAFAEYDQPDPLIERMSQ